jgi:Phage integrase, N-terminal SAM-like domain
MSTLAPTMQAFFTDRLIRERDASPNTIAAYRDTIRLLITYASHKLGVEPSSLELNQLDASLIGAFLDHLETDRGCGARTATPAWPRSAPSTGTACCVTQNTPRRSSGSCRSGPNATNARPSPISPNLNSTR